MISIAMPWVMGSYIVPIRFFIGIPTLSDEEVHKISGDSLDNDEEGTKVNIFNTHWLFLWRMSIDSSWSWDWVRSSLFVLQQGGIHCVFQRGRLDVVRAPKHDGMGVM